MASGPLSDTLARLSRDNPYRRLVVGDPGAGWVGWEDIVADDDLLDAWYGEMLTGPAAGHPDVAGSFLVIALSGAVVDVTAAALLGDRRAFSLRGSDLALHRDPSGWCDGLAIRSPAVRVLAGDPDAGHPDGTVVTPSVLASGTATGLAALLTPAFERVRARAPFGRSGMWGSVADHAGLVASRLLRGGVAGAWDGAVALFDGLAAAAPGLRSRPSLCSIDWEDGPSPFSIRGTCCLLYKVAPGAERTTGEGYCVTCPLLPDPTRRERLAEWARREAGP